MGIFPNFRGGNKKSLNPPPRFKGTQLYKMGFQLTNIMIDILKFACSMHLRKNIPKNILPPKAGEKKRVIFHPTDSKSMKKITGITTNPSPYWSCRRLHPPKINIEPEKWMVFVQMDVVPQNGWFIMENPIKMDDLGRKPTILGNPQMLFQFPTGALIFSGEPAGTIFPGCQPTSPNFQGLRVTKPTYPL